MKTPVLFLTDSPDCPSGLARIGRDLAMLMQDTMGDRVDVGYLGRGGVGGKFPFPTWVIPHNLYGLHTVAEWGASIIHQVWHDFAGDRKGVVFSIWDPGRMIWLSRPEFLQEDSAAKTFLLDPPFETWGYFPVDGHTESGGLGQVAIESLKGYDRILAYGPYGAAVLKQAMPGRDVRWIPHMLNPSWYPRDRKASREYFGYQDHHVVVGVVATNQRRKDWGLAAQVGKRLKTHFGDRFKQWWHIDMPVKDWNIMELCSEYGLETCTMVTMPPQSDNWLATAYSCCDVTLAIGSEGFGYPIVESQACGVPVIHGNYAGGASWVPDPNQMLPKAFAVDGLSAVLRPAFNPRQWAERAIELVYFREKHGSNDSVGDVRSLRPDIVWPKWKAWFERGLDAL